MPRKRESKREYEYSKPVKDKKPLITRACLTCGKTFKARDRFTRLCGCQYWNISF